jgi:hypothetical protein
MGPAGAVLVWFVPHWVGWIWIAATLLIGVVAGWFDRDAQLAAAVMEKSFTLAIDAHHGIKAP